MLLCTHCGAEEMDLPLTIAVPAKGFLREKDNGSSTMHWSQVSQKICPVCGAHHVSIACSPKPGLE